MKNYYKDFKKFKEEQLELEGNENINSHWDGWVVLYSVYKFANRDLDENR